MVSAAAYAGVERRRPVPLPSHFQILPAHLVPSADPVRRAIDARLLKAVADAVAEAAGLPHAVAAAKLCALHDSLAMDARTAPPSIPFDRPADSRDAVLIADDAAHDRYFRIRRVTLQPETALVRSLLRAAALYHAEMDLSYPDRERDRFRTIGGGFMAILAHLAGGSTPPIEQPSMPTPGVWTRNAMARWIVGHQIFATLSQALIVAMQGFEEAMAAAALDAAASALRLTADLLLASASAFRFAAEFDPTDYGDTIRPTMSPEQVGRGFSGLLSADHRVLIQVMQRTRPLMAQATAELAPEHQRLTHALQHVYDDHKFVCARFGGDAAASLRSGPTVEVASVELLDRFKQARLRLLRSSREKGAGAS